MTNFSTMTNDQLDEWLAVNVMGWMLDLVENEWGLRYYRDADGKSVMDARLWQPTCDLNQAVECAEKIGNGENAAWAIVRNSHNAVELLEYPKYRGECQNHFMDVYKSYSDNPARALCEAVAMAVEGEK